MIFNSRVCSVDGRDMEPYRVEPIKRSHRFTFRCLGTEIETTISYRTTYAIVLYFDLKDNSVVHFIKIPISQEEIIPDFEATRMFYSLEYDKYDLDYDDYDR